MADHPCCLEKSELPPRFHHGEILSLNLHVATKDYFDTFHEAYILYQTDSTKDAQPVTLQCKWPMVRCVKRVSPPNTPGEYGVIEMHIRAISPRAGAGGCLLGPLNLLPEEFLRGLGAWWRQFSDRRRKRIPIGSGSGSGLGSNNQGSTHDLRDIALASNVLGTVILRVRSEVSGVVSLSDTFRIEED